MEDNQRNLFEKNDSITWEAKHIRYFNGLPQVGRATIFELVQYFPNLDDWDLNVAKTVISNKKCHDYLPGKIPALEEFDDEHVITFLDKNYPDIFHSMGVEKPLMLWYNGNLNIGRTIAVIGSRDIHPKTIEITKQFTSIAVDKGFNIVSGLALGTDTVGHKTAVENSSKTTVILPGPLDKITPSENKELVTQILENDGLLLSEYPPGTAIERKNFVERDRIQAGLSEGVFVGQSGIPGGTLHTVRYTLKYDRKLLVFDPSSEEKQYEGNNRLINEVAQNEDFNYLNIKTKKTVEALQAKKVLADFIITTEESINDSLEKI